MRAVGASVEEFSCNGGERLVAATPVGTPSLLVLHFNTLEWRGGVSAQLPAD